MLLLQGQVIGVVVGEFTDRETLVVSPTYTVEILHKVKGKSKVDTVKIESEVLAAWQKVEGQVVNQEVAVYALASGKGVVSGFMLADKKDLPNLLKKVSGGV